MPSSRSHSPLEAIRSILYPFIPGWLSKLEPIRNTQKAVKASTAPIPVRDGHRRPQRCFPDSCSAPRVFIVPKPLLPLWNHRPLSYIAIKDDFPSITLTKIKGTQMDKSHILSHSHTNPTSPHQFTPHSVGWQNPTQPQTSLYKQWMHRYHNCEINKKVQLSKLSHQKENR